MFVGRYIHRIDSKGRLFLPARLREAGRGVVYSEFVVTKGVGGCLAILPVDDFESFLAEFIPEDIPPDRQIAFYREFASWAHVVPVDGQGRINLPQVLIDEVGLGEEVLILGVVDWIEVWDPTRYSDYSRKVGAGYDEGALQFFSSLIRGRRTGKTDGVPSQRDGE